MNDPVIHIDSGDGLHALCGVMITRDDPVTTKPDGEGADCLQCLIAFENREGHEL